MTNNDFLAERSIRLPFQLHRRTITSWARPTGRETNGGQFSQAICLQKVCKQKIPQSFNLCYRVGQIAAAEQSSRRRSRFDVRVKGQSYHLCFCHLCFYIVWSYLYAVAFQNIYLYISIIASFLWVVLLSSLGELLKCLLLVLICSFAFNRYRHILSGLPKPNKLTHTPFMIIMHKFSPLPSPFL